MINAIKRSRLYDYAITRKMFTLSHSLSTLLIWTLAVAGTSRSIMSLIQSSLAESAKAFDNASGPFSLLHISSTGEGPISKAIATLFNSLSVLFVPLLPRNDSQIPVLPQQYKQYQEQNLPLHWVTPEPKVILMWFITAIASIIFFILLIDYVYELLGILFWYNYASNSFQQSLSVIFGLALIGLWFYILIGRLRDGNVLNPKWSIVLVGYVIFLTSMSMFGLVSNLLILIILLAGLFVASYIGFCALFIASDAELSFKRKAKRRDDFKLKHRLKNIKRGNK